MVRVRERYSNHHVADLARSALPHRDGTKHLILRAGHPCRTAPYGAPLMSAMNTGDASRRRGPPDLGICLVLRHEQEDFVCRPIDRDWRGRKHRRTDGGRSYQDKFALSFSQQNAVTTALSSFNHWNLDGNQKNVLFAECIRSAVLSAVSVFAFLTSQSLHD